MTTLDQCPSTKGSKEVETGALASPAPGQPWRSLDEYAGTPEFRDFVEREFPAGASELARESRRSFMKVMGAGLAIAGAATVPGCRRPAREIMTYAQTVPEEIIPGKPLYYATSLPLPGGGAEGLLIETHAGRPTKVEGNPLHPINRGKSSSWAQASVLDIYDPDRLKNPVFHNQARGKLNATWDDFKGWQGEHFARFDATGGAGLVFVVDKKSSPTRDAMRDAVKGRWPAAEWVAYNPTETRGVTEGTRVAFGAPVRVRHALADAQRVLSLDSDFMHEGPEALVCARDFAATRNVHNSGDDMSRLYVAESRPSGTGSLADHRMRMSPTEITAMAAEVARHVFAGAGIANASSLVEGLVSVPTRGDERGHENHAQQIAEDLLAHRGRSVVIAGASQPAEVHALVAAMNEAIGAVGSLVGYTPMSDEEAADCCSVMADLANRLGNVDTLVCIDANPAYDVPGFADALEGVGTLITLSVGPTETSDTATWSLNEAHPLESWGDAQAWDDTVAPTQPMIAPLYEPALSEIEFLALLAGPDHGGSDNPDGHELVTRTWSARTSTPLGDAFDKIWRRALHDGVLAGSGARAQRPNVNWGAIRGAIGALAASLADQPDGLEVVFRTGRRGDGRSANNAWLQELPDVATSVTWDNPVCVSPRTAERLDLLPPGADADNANPYTKQQMPKARLATLNVGGRECEVAVWVLPGMPDNVAAVELGGGRTVCGLVGNDVGHNTFAVKPAGASTAAGASLTRTGGTQTIASTQNHWTMEDRTTIVRAMDKKWFDKHAAKPPKSKPDKIYGTELGSTKLNVAEQLGELAHTPEVISIYENPENASRADAAEGSIYSKGPQWGMTIDMNACTGCGTCTIACQSENNIPVVGKSEVAKGREMQWIRIDRYFTGDVNNPDQMLMQPIACVHCENAPCETVCPVNATVHGPEGTNNMAYNRCIGTRYCANNCPYKVRRFNFFDWAQSKFRGGLDASYVGEDIKKRFEEGVAADRTFNQNFIPPRLREKVDEITKMQRNPDVTVRSRGVMEKCTYCIQRVNAARAEVKINGMWNEPDQTGPIPDGFFQVACQQACPTDAIAFGDILDPSAKVTELRDSSRGYALLGYLATRPRTSHLMRVRNPNAAIREYDLHDPLHHGPSHGDEHHDDGHGDAPDDGHAFVDPLKKRFEDGYTMSLRVLGQGITGVQA